MSSSFRLPDSRDALDAPVTGAAGNSAHGNRGLGNPAPVLPPAPVPPPVLPVGPHRSSAPVAASPPTAALPPTLGSPLKPPTIQPVAPPLAVLPAAKPLQPVAAPPIPASPAVAPAPAPRVQEAAPASGVPSPRPGALGRPLPPPPPPRSSPAPVRAEPVPTRRMAGIKADAAMGSAATGVRWKGELAAIENAVPANAEEPTLKEDLTRAMPSWLVSLVVHLVLLVLLALLAGPVGPNFGRVLLTMGQAEGTSDTQLDEFAIEQEPTTETEVDEMLTEESVDVTLPPLDAVGTEFSEQTFAPVPVEVGLGEPAIPASPMVGGRSGSMKKTLLLIYGGTPLTESAVASGLQWLAKNQTKDGSWSLRGPYDDGGTNENRTAATAMALLAFMGAGNTHMSGEYAKVVDRGARYLVKKQNRDGFFAAEARDHQQAYAQAQCSVAICELYAMTKDSWLRDPAQRAVKCAEEWQASEGGWRYQPRFDSDTSVTGWFVMALQSALAGGLEVDRAVLYRVSDFLDTVQSYDGAGYSYQPRGAPSQAMTAEGLLCRQYLGWPRNHKALVRGVDALSTDYIFDMNEADYYYWYYATQVLHHYGGAPWDKWNQVMRVELPKAQIRRGAESGSWAPQADRWGGTGGRLYTTCMAIYCLEVYYRHMPLYKADVDEKPIEGASKAVD